MADRWRDADPTPLDLPRERLAALVGRLPGAAILESSGDFGAAGRWSIYAAFPIQIFEADEHSWRLTGNRTYDTGQSDPLDRLGELWNQFENDCSDRPLFDNRPFFQGGLIGYFGYDLAPRLERLPRKALRESRFPVLRFGLYDTFVTHDHATGHTALWALDLGGPEMPCQRIDIWRYYLDHLLAQTPWRGRAATPVTSNFTRSDYLDGVRRALEYIRAGDIFQVNLSQRFEARIVDDPLALYLRLRQISPAPYSAYLAWDSLAILSASPELFFETQGDRIVTRPIKGTRPRGETSEIDRRLAEELRASAKDRAELTMIIDLERNDLGRVCRYGSVRVVDPLSVESYAQVHHLVATVEGRLRADRGPMDVVRAVFPGGSITGAPKIRAMQIIDELEPSRRGVYTGAIGYFGRGGVSAFNIAIRTLLVDGDRATYQVGGGIVADSVPELEYEETLHKGRGLRAVLEGAEP